jgi:hypothetical protein
MGYDKAMDNAANNDFRPDTSPKKYLNSRNHSRPQSSETLMSRTDPLSNENKLRITTEINVLRNSMDTLPALASATSVRTCLVDFFLINLADYLILLYCSTKILGTIRKIEINN